MNDFSFIFEDYKKEEKSSPESPQKMIDPRYLYIYDVEYI